MYYEVTCLIVAGVNDDNETFEAGMKALKAVAPNAPVNLLAMVPQKDEEADLVPSAEKMHALLDIAAQYFEQVGIVDRNESSLW